MQYVSANNSGGGAYLTDKYIYKMPANNGLQVKHTHHTLVKLQKKSSVTDYIRMKCTKARILTAFEKQLKLQITTE